MTKYTRSKDKLIALIKEVFSVCEISLDTKVIVLLLAATLSRKRFRAWINKIPALNPLNCLYREINTLRHDGGTIFRDYIILSALNAVAHDVSSDELQQFIREANCVPNAQEISPALTQNELAVEIDFDKMRADFVLAKESAYKFLLDKSQEHKINLKFVTDAYLIARSFANPIIAYNATIHAICDILSVYDPLITDQYMQSKKLLDHALEPFITSEKHNKLMLNSYSIY